MKQEGLVSKCDNNGESRVMKMARGRGKMMHRRGRDAVKSQGSIKDKSGEII